MGLRAARVGDISHRPATASPPTSAAGPNRGRAKSVDAAFTNRSMEPSPVSMSVPPRTMALPLHVDRTMFSLLRVADPMSERSGTRRSRTGFRTSRTVAEWNAHRGQSVRLRYVRRGETVRRRVSGIGDGAAGFRCRADASATSWRSRCPIPLVSRHELIRRWRA
jgi:hypothetical protein